MAKFLISEDNKDWLKANHPDLYFDPDRSTICGELLFRMYYSKREKAKYVINPDSSYKNKDGIIIQDVYEIEIDLYDPEFLPKVKERHWVR